MRFAEIFLRIGSALVAWMVLYAHLLWLAALRTIGCGPDGDEIYLLLLGMVPLSCGASLLLGVTRPLPEVHSMLRWLAVPLLLLLPLALRSTWAVIVPVHVHGEPICGAGDVPAWEVLWAPAQLLTLGLVTAMVLRSWIQARRAMAARKSMDQSP